MFSRSSIVMVAFFFLGCGKKDAAPSQYFQAIGPSIWQGTYKITKDLKKAETPQVQRIKFHFEEEQMFRMEEAEKNSWYMNGKFTDMPKTRNLLIDVKESTFELAAASGASQVYDYSSEENELVLTSEESSIFLVRDGEAEDAVSESPLLKNWLCNHPDGSQWQFNISESSFRVTRKVGGQPAAFFEGVTKHSKVTDSSNVSTYSAAHEVKTSSVAKLVGWKLNSTYDLETKAMTVATLDSQGTGSDQQTEFVCYAQ